MRWRGAIEADAEGRRRITDALTAIHLCAIQWRLSRARAARVGKAPGRRCGIEIAPGTTYRLLLHVLALEHADWCGAVQAVDWSVTVGGGLPNPIVRFRK